MQVNNNANPGVIQNTHEQQKTNIVASTTTQNQTQHSQNVGNTDSLSLTQTATQLQMLEQHVKSAPVTDIQRVERIKSAIEADQYNPDPVQIADKMLNFESTLNNRRSFI